MALENKTQYISIEMKINLEHLHNLRKILKKQSIKNFG